MSASNQHWRVEFDSGIPVYKQIINQVCSDLDQGILKVGDKLPTIKALKELLEINPNTVVKAYRDLEFMNILTSRRGSGCFIAALPTPNQLSADEKKQKLQALYHRMASEASSFGINESEIKAYINNHTNHNN